MFNKQGHFCYNTKNKITNILYGTRGLLYKKKVLLYIFNIKDFIILW